MNNVVLAYAERFWSPGAVPTDGIGLVSNRIYLAIREVYPDHNLIFVDFNQVKSVAGLTNVDHFFGVSTNFDKFCKVLNPKIATLIAVNEHPLLRRTIKFTSKKHGYSHKFLESHDGIYSNLREDKFADNVIAFGSLNTLSSYELAGFDTSKIFPIGWHYWDNYFDEPIDYSGTEILVFLGAICNRKGVGLLGEIVQFIRETNPRFKVKLVGLTYNTNWDAYLEDLENHFPENFVWLRMRIVYGSKEWVQLRENVAFAIFPSFEEGLAGCAMDVINLGIPLIHSSKTGIEVSHPFLLNFDFENRDIRQALSQLIQGGSSLWNEIYDAQKSAAFFQNSNNDSIIEAIRRSRSGNSWPGLSFEAGRGFEHDFGQEFIDFWSSNASKYLLKMADDNRPNLQIIYIGDNFLPFLSKLKIAVFILEKYNNHQAVGFSILTQDQEFVIERICSIDASALNVTLYIPEYSNLFLDEKRSLKVLYFREKCSDLFIFISYWVSRFFKITFLKIRFEIKKWRSIFPSV